MTVKAQTAVLFAAPFQNRGCQLQGFGKFGDGCESVHPFGANPWLGGCTELAQEESVDLFPPFGAPRGLFQTVGIKDGDALILQPFEAHLRFAGRGKGGGSGCWRLVQIDEWVGTQGVENTVGNFGHTATRKGERNDQTGGRPEG